MRVPRLTSWWSALALLLAIRVAIPLAALVADGSKLPGIPRFTRDTAAGGLTGDATGFYAATREFMAAWRRMPHLRPWLAAAALGAFGVVICVDVHWMQPSGAAVFGWPLVWALPMLAYRALGFGLSKHVAWDFGVALSLVFVALTVVAVAYLGRNATGHRWAGLLAAGFW